MNAFCLPILQHSVLWENVLSAEDRKAILPALPQVIDILRKNGQVTDQQLRDIYPDVRHMGVHDYDKNRDSWKCISRKRSMLLLHSEFLAATARRREEDAIMRQSKADEAAARKASKVRDEEERVAKKIRDEAERSAKKVREEEERAAKKDEAAAKRASKAQEDQERREVKAQHEAERVAKKVREEEERATKKHEAAAKRASKAQEDQERRELKAQHEAERVAKKAAEEKDAEVEADKKQKAKEKEAEQYRMQEEKKNELASREMEAEASREMEAEAGKKRKAAEKKVVEHQIQIQPAQEADVYRCFFCDGVPSSKGSEKRALRHKKLANKRMIGTWQTCEFAVDGGGGCDRFVCDDQDCITWLVDKHESGCCYQKNNVANSVKKPKK